MATNAVNSTGREFPPFPVQRGWLWIANIVLTMVGLVDSIYLSYEHLTRPEFICEANIYCPPQWNYTVGPIPAAYLGLAAYLVILLMLLFETQIPRAKIVVFGLILIGILFSTYLTLMEFYLAEWCVWCVISAITMFLLYGVSFGRLWQAISNVPGAQDEEDAA